MKQNLMREPLVWMTEADYARMNDCVNILGALLDGEPLSAETVERWDAIQRDAVDASLRAKFVPENALDKLRLVVMSD